MGNVLRIYDYELNHIEEGKLVTFYDLGKSHPGLQENLKNCSEETIDSENIRWSLILDSFRLKITNDLNTEVLINKRAQQIIKRGSKGVKDGKINNREINRDDEDKIIYSVLHGGKITENAVLEKLKENQDEPTYANLNGDRIYDQMFFLLHLSFRCNKARLFILTKKNNIVLDNTLKKYLATDLFKTDEFPKQKWSDFIPKELQKEALGRTMINNITVSKNEIINSEILDDEYEIEIKLKSKNKKPFNKVTKKVVETLRNSVLKYNDKEVKSKGGEVKFQINDPISKTKRTVAFGDTSNFIPRFEYEDSEVLFSNKNIDQNKVKKICLNYISYDEENLI